MLDFSIQYHNLKFHFYKPKGRTKIHKIYQHLYIFKGWFWKWSHFETFQKFLSLLENKPLKNNLILLKFCYIISK